MTFSNLDQCVISRNSISYAVTLHKCLVSPKTSRQPRCPHTCPRHYRFTRLSAHLSMTFTCINITCAPYISRANLLFSSHLHTPSRRCAVHHAIPSPTSQTTSRRYINLRIITFDLFLNYLNMSTTNIDRNIEE